MIQPLDAPPALPPELAAQLAVLLPLLSAWITGRLRRRMIGWPKVALPLTCAVIAALIAWLSQLAVSLATGGDLSGAHALVGTAVGFASLLLRQVKHELERGEAIRGKGSATMGDLTEIRRGIDGTGRKPPPGALALAALLLLPAAAKAGSVHWCSDIECNSGVREVRPLNPACDPWADGRFEPTDPADLSCFRQRYGYPFTLPGAWRGFWCSQHGPCSAVVSRFETVTGWRLVLGGACLEAGEQGRRGCDAVATAGIDLGCTMLPCGIASCPGEPRECPTGSGSSDGYHREPLRTLPPEHRPPNVHPQIRTLASGPPDACAWVNRSASPPRLFLITSRPVPCCDGMPTAACCTPAGMTADCWSTPPAPRCGDGTCNGAETCSSCPADCGPCAPPAEDIVILDCSATGWRVRVRGADAVVALGGLVEVGGVRVRLPAECAGECPAAEILSQVRAVPGVCQ